jgi:hypothetical protein
MRIYSASFQPDVARKTRSVSGSVCAVAIVVVAIWLFAGAPGVASSYPRTQPAASLAARLDSDVTQVFPAALTARPAQVAAIDEEDGDDDQADPDDPDDTLAAADAFWWGAADATLRAA